jgi:hypothetical protein
LLIKVQSSGALASARVTAHQRAPRLFVERIEAEQLLGMLDRTPEGPILFEEADKPGENGPRTLTETFAVGIDPLACAVGKDVALIQTCRFLQRGTVSRQAAIGGGLEDHQVYRRAALTPRQSAGACIDERVQLGPRFSELVELAAEIGQRLGVARFRPERACDPLTLDRSAASMENQEGDELLLSRAWKPGCETAVRENTEASEQLHAQNVRDSHGSRLHATSTRPTFKFGGCYSGAGSGPRSPLAAQSAPA